MGCLERSSSAVNTHRAVEFRKPRRSHRHRNTPNQSSTKYNIKVDEEWDYCSHFTDDNTMLLPAGGAARILLGLDGGKILL